MILQQSKSHQTVREFAGTPVYAAPEQFEHRPGIASDQYALGTVAYEWLTGEWPFQGEYWAIGTQKLTNLPPPLRDKVPSISPEVEQVVLRALAKAPKDRFPGIQAFAAALEEAGGNVSGSETFCGRSSPPHSPHRSPELVCASCHTSSC